MKLSISSHGSTNPSILEKSRKEVRRNDKNAKVSLKELMVVNAAEVKVLRRGAMQMKNDLKDGKRTRCVV